MYKYENLGLIFLIMIPFCFYYGIHFIKKGVRNLKIAKGFRRDNLTTTIGDLTYKQVYQDQVIGFGKYSRHYEKQWTEYSYTYHVRGKTYKISSGTPFDPKSVAKNVTVTYQKSAPEYAIISDIYEPEYESNGYKQILGGCLLIVLALIFLTLVLLDTFWQM